MKTGYKSITKLQAHLEEKIKFVEGKFDEDDLGFIVDNNTVLHLYALNEENLEPIVNYLIENKPEYLIGIMIKNNQDKTPLDIASKNENTRTLRLMFKGLEALKQDHASKRLYEVFPALILSGSKTFQDYLNTCFFQTIQMKSMQYLSMKSSQDEIITSHTSCILSSEFLDKMMNKSPEENILKEKMKQLQIMDEEFQKEKEKAEEERRAKKQREKEEKERKKNEAKEAKGAKANADDEIGKNDVRFEEGKMDMSLEKHSEDRKQAEDESKDSRESNESDSFVTSYDDDDEGDYESSGSYYDNDEDEEDDEEDLEGGSSDNKKSTDQNDSQSNKDNRDKMPTKVDDIKIGINAQNSLKKHDTVKEDKELTRDELIQQLENEKVQLEKKLRSSRKKYEVKGIEFSWLFKSQPRVNFLRALNSNKADIEIFSLDLIKYCLLFLWSYYRWVIMIFIYIPFLSYFVTFILYATWIHNEKEKEDDTNGPYNRANNSMISIIFAAIAMNSVLEFNKLYYEKWRYFISFWNFASFASLVLNTFLVIADLSDLKETHFLPVSACAVLLMWVKLFYFCRIFMQTAKIVRMLYQIFIKIVNFLIILGLMVLAFANTFYIIARIEDTGFAGDSFWRAITYSYLNGLGSFNLDEFQSNWWGVYTKSIWLVSVFLIFLVLLNMLIAIISDIFEMVHEKSYNNLLKELTGMMLDTNWIFRLLPIFRENKYIIVFVKEQGEREQGDENSRISQMKKHMENIIMKKQYNSAFQNLDKFLEEKIEQRGIFQEASANVHFAAIREKFKNYEEKIKMYEEICKELNKLDVKSIR